MVEQKTNFQKNQKNRAPTMPLMVRATGYKRKTRSTMPLQVRTDTIAKSK